MYITHPTDIPIKFEDSFIREFLKNHMDIINHSKNESRIDTHDSAWRITKSPSIPNWK